MATILQYTLFELAKRELVVLSDARDHELTCVSGELWITLDGDRRDIILGPGASFRAETRAPIVVSAVAAATLNVRHSVAAAPRLAGARRMLCSLLNWEFPPLAALPSPLIR